MSWPFKRSATPSKAVDPLSVEIVETYDGFHIRQPATGHVWSRWCYGQNVSDRFREDPHASFCSLIQRKTVEEAREEAEKARAFLKREADWRAAAQRRDQARADFGERVVE